MCIRDRPKGHSAQEFATNVMDDIFGSEWTEEDKRNHGLE